MGAEAKGLAERLGLYILVGDGEVKGEEKMNILYKELLTIYLW